MRTRGLLVAAALAGAQLGCEGADAVIGAPPDAAPEPWQCPPGEQCVDDQAYRYQLVGTSTSDFHLPWTPYDTAVGGVQTYHVLRDGRPFDDFEVRTDPAANLLDVAPPDIVTQAQEGGKAIIRLVQPGTGLLYNRFEVIAHQAAEVRVGAKAGGYNVLWRDPVDWFVVAGRPLQVVISLRSIERRRLVDQRLTIAAAPGDGAIVEQLVWDRAEVTPAAGGDTRLAIGVGDGTVLEAVVPVIDEAAIDDILLASFGDSVDLYYASTYLLCWSSFAEGRLVVNLPVTLTVDPALNPSPYPDADDPPTCIFISPEWSGTYLITAQAGILTKDFPITLH